MNNYFKKFSYKQKLKRKYKGYRAACFWLIGLQQVLFYLKFVKKNNDKYVYNKVH